MAKHLTTLTEYTDDIDGTSAVGTVSFAYKGQSYEIDLSKANTKAFEKVMAGYVQHARGVRVARRRRAGTLHSRDLAAVRAWAHENGFDVSQRGRVAAGVIEAYDAAQ